MNTNRPRDSILSLFDPLATPATPERELSSPDSASDKENDGPGPVTIFFNRIYTKQQTSSHVSTPSTGKLIDFGDISVRDESDASLLDEDGMDLDFGGSDDDSQLYNRVSSPTPEKAVSPTRQPLADIRLETVSEPTPISKSTEELSPPDSSSWSEDPVPISPTTVAPPGAPLADVINSINLSAMAASEASSPLSIHLSNSSSDELPLPEDQPQGTTDRFPEITICPPDAETLVSSHPTTPVSSPTSHEAPRPAMRRLHANTHAADPRRTSVDLQSSFSLQMQSPEMSFDLLNDKISFLSQESCGDDDTLDFRMSPKPMPVIVEEGAKQTPSSPPARVDDHVAARPTVFSKPGQSAGSSRSSISTTATTRLEDAQPPEEDVEQTLSRPSAMGGVTSTPAVSSSQSSVFHAVPALRIFKKAWKMHDRTSSVSSASTTSTTSISRARSNTTGPSSSTSSSRSSSRCDLVETEEHMLKLSIGSQQAPTEPPKPKTLIRGLKRPPPGAQLPPTKPIGSDRIRAARSVTQPAPRPSIVRNAPGISRAAGAPRPSIAMAAPSTKPVRPVPGSAATTTTAATGSRASQRAVPSASASSGVRSGLPLPSRLPGPSSARGIPTRAGSSKLPAVSRRVL